MMATRTTTPIAPTSSPALERNDKSPALPAPIPPTTPLLASVTLLLAMGPGCFDEGVTYDDGETQTSGDSGEGGDGDSGDGELGDGDGDSGDGDGDGDGDSGDGDSGDGDGDGESESDLCGDGIVAGDEECDDGNPYNDDSCTNECVLAECGDSIVWTGVEECDLGGNNGPNNACTDACLVNVCGDGQTGPGEGCDDGNDIDDDACTNACAPADCGDGIVGPDELCDDGNDVETDACLSTCVESSCGDGFVFADVEGCDEAEFNSDSGMCTADCAIAVCGDGLVWNGFEVCDDGNANDFDACTTSCTGVVQPTLELSISEIKQFEFSWDPVFGADYYQLLESADTGEPYQQVGEEVVGFGTSLTVPLHLRLNASYKLRACNDEGCGDSAAVDVYGSLAEAVGYFKASNPHTSDWFGASVVLSGDGNTLAIGAPLGGANVGGSVHLFVRDGQNVWSQQAELAASNPHQSDHFGASVTLSEDGDTLAVGAHFESSNATSIGGNEADDSAPRAGAVYMFVRNQQDVWSQQAYLKPSNNMQYRHFGWSVALAADGDTLAVGAFGDLGFAYAFVRNGQGTWSQQAALNLPNVDSDRFGWSVGLSEDGDTMAVGAPYEDSSAVGIGGSQVNNSATDAGAAYVFVRSGQDVWSQPAYIKASNTGVGDRFGASVALSGDGYTLVVGAPHEDSNAVGIVGANQGNNSSSSAGAVYVFVRGGQNTWSQQAYVKASNTGASDYFGWSVALSEDGDTLAAASRHEDSSAVGIGGSQANNSLTNAGAVYVFEREGQDAWSQQAYVKASNPDAFDGFGGVDGPYGQGPYTRTVALSADGHTLAVGAYGERSSAGGVGGDQADDSLTNAGAVYLY